MNTIHSSLMQKYPWYERWHRKHHTITHWVLFILIACIVTGGTLTAITGEAFAAKNSVNDAEIFAKANGLHLLQEGEYAITTRSQGAKSGKIKKENLLLDGGDVTIERSVDQNTSLDVTEYQPGVNTYVKANDPNVEIGSVYNTDGREADGKTDKAIKLKLKKHTTIPVIVTMKTSYGRYYDKSDSSTKRSAKSAEFKQKHDSVARAITGNGKFKRDLQIINGVALDVNQKALEALSKNTDVDHIDLDREVYPTLDTSVDQIQASTVWQLADAQGNPVTGNGMRIAVLDTGVDYTHPDLGGCLGPNCKVVGGYDFYSNDSDPMDEQGHGTHVAATAAGNGLLKGVAPDAKILAYKIAGSGGSSSSSIIIAAVNRAVDPNQDGNPADHVDVGTLSFGGPCGAAYSSSCGPTDDASTAIDNATLAGVVFTVAAGNSGPNQSTVNSPGTAPGAITVAASCKTSQVSSTSTTCATPIAKFSSQGPVIYNGTDYHKPDIAAPGVSICAARWGSAFNGSPTCFDTSHIRISGTSMATPHMAGVAALLRQMNPSLTPAQIKDRLKSTARDLGRPYNEEGAGEVNAAVAIPSLFQVTPTPSVWRFTTSPTTKLSTTTQSFSVTTTDSGSTTPTIQFQSSQPGITFTSSKTTLNLAGGATDTFTGTVTVDNDVVPAGIYNTTIFFVQNGVKKGAVPVIITVTPTLTITPATLDYDIDNPALTSWTSQTVPVIITNKRTDISRTLSLAASGLPSGTTYQMSQSAVTLTAGASATINTNLVVNNTLVANGAYSGVLQVTDSSNVASIAIPVVYKKYYALKLQDSSSAGGFVNASLTLYTRATKTVTNVITSSNPYVIYYGSPQTIDLKVNYVPEGDGTTDGYYEVVKEGINVNGVVTVNLNKSEATNTLALALVDADGRLYGARDTSNGCVSYCPLYDSATTLGTRYLTLTDVTNGVKFGPSYQTLWQGIDVPFHTNNISSNYLIEYTAASMAASLPHMYLAYGGSTGITGSKTFTNTPADYKKLIIGYNDMNIPAGGTVIPSIWHCDARGNSGCAVDAYAEQRTLPYTQTIYSLWPQETKVGLQVLAIGNGISNSQNGCVSGTPCYKAFASPLINVASGSRRLWNDIGGSMLTPVSGDTYYLGLGPMFWALKFQNTTTLVKLVNNFSGYTFNTPFLTQDYSAGQSAPMDYSITKDGTLFNSGTFPLSTLQMSYYKLSLTATTGNYTFQTSFPYKSHMQDLNATVVEKFNNALSDPNPPFIKRMYFYTNGMRSEVYDATSQNKIELEFDPNGGTLATPTLAYSLNGTSFTPVTLANASGVYSATLPAVTPTTNKITLRILSTDAAGNSLEYTFEVPATGVAAVDTTPPVASITAPLAGATLTSTTTISANATDNTGVDHVDFYAGATLIGADSSAPYSISWNTTTVANGTYSLTAKAYDAAGNVGTSTGVSVTVNNVTTPPPDTTPPVASMVEPMNGATVSGTTAVSATATDNVGVTKVDFYDGATLISTDTTATGSTYSVSWDTRTAASGSHTLKAKAYDAAGNVTQTASITVTVSNSSDATPPTVSITSPTNGAAVQSGSMVVAASASDNVGVSTVYIYVGSTLLCTDTSAPYSCFWNVPKAKGRTYTLTAKAYDAAGNIGTSVPVTVTKN